MNAKLKKRLRKRLFAISDKCCYCDKRLDEQTATIEHYIPKYCGGTHDIWNLKLACEPCNRQYGSLLSNVAALHKHEQKLRQAKFARSFLGRVHHVFRPNYEYHDVQKLERLCKNLQLSLASRMSKIKKYPLSYRKLIGA